MTAARPVILQAIGLLPDVDRALAAVDAASRTEAFFALRSVMCATRADFVVFDSLKKFTVRQTYKKGVLVAENGRFLGRLSASVPLPRSTMNLRYQPADLEVKAARAGKIRIIEIVPQQIVTKAIIARPKVENGRIVADVGRDILKLVVVERHRATGNVGVGFVRGFKLRFHLFTIPGQVLSRASHVLVLKGVDGLVLVLDSQDDRHAANVEAVNALRADLGRNDYTLDATPWVIQYNKRDLPNAVSVEDLRRTFNHQGVPEVADADHDHVRLVVPRNLGC